MKIINFKFSFSLKENFVKASVLVHVSNKHFLPKLSNNEVEFVTLFNRKRFDFWCNKKNYCFMQIFIKYIQAK